MNRYSVKPPSVWNKCPEKLLVVPYDRPKLPAFPLMAQFAGLTSEDMFRIIDDDYPNRWTLLDVQVALVLWKEPPIEWYETLRHYVWHHFGQIEDVVLPDLYGRNKEITFAVSFETIEIPDFLLNLAMFNLPADSKVYLREIQ